MPLDGTELQILGDPRLDKLAQIERLLIDERRWCKRRLRDEYGRYCLVGAMQAVEALQSLEPIILRAAREVGGRRYWRVESFNDNPHTTHVDVLGVLQRARENILAGMIESSPRPRYARWRKHCARCGRIRGPRSQPLRGPLSLEPRAPRIPQ